MGVPRVSTAVGKEWEGEMVGDRSMMAAEGMMFAQNLGGGNAVAHESR